MGDYKRITYTEADGAVVVLDIDGETVSLRRRDAWLTYGMFNPTETTELMINNEFGDIRFDVEIESMKIETYYVYMRYHLKQAGDIVDSHVFECRWEPEV